MTSVMRRDKSAINILPKIENHKLSKNMTAKTLRPITNIVETTISKDSFVDQLKKRSQKDFIDEANKIMRERMKNKSSSINSKTKLKSIVLKDTKEICLKNYLIDLLKDKRTDINRQEKNIIKALKDSEARLDGDFKTFVDFVENTKLIQKKREEQYLNVKNKHEVLDREYKERIEENRKYNDELEKMIKVIYILQSYASFVHKVMGTEFPLKPINEADCREKRYDKVAKVIIKDYEKILAAKSVSFFNDDSLLITKFGECEAKVLQIIDEKQIIQKEIEFLRKGYEEELKELERRQKDCKDETARLYAEKKQLNIDIITLKSHRINEVGEHLTYINEIGAEICNITKEKGKKKGLLDSSNYIREILETLFEKEKIVNKNIREIEGLLKNDAGVIDKIKNRKKANKSEKQLQLKEQEDYENILKRIKSDERAQRVIIKGRKVPQDYPILKKKTKKVNNEQLKENDDYAMLNYSSEDNSNL